MSEPLALNRVQQVYMLEEFAGLSFMANYRSFNLKDIAESVGLSVHEYMISCFYCHKWLTVHEKLLYLHAELLVVWKEEYP